MDTGMTQGLGGGQSNGIQGPLPQGQPLPPDPQLPPTPEDPQKTAQKDLDGLLNTVNIAEEMEEEGLDKIGQDVVRGFQVDLQSKSDWDRSVDDWIKLAAQVKEPKNTPWPNASNVKYPLLATAAMQFAARAYPNLVPADGKIVQFRVVGADPKGEKAVRADKLAKHMNYQLMEHMADWEEEMDRLLIQIPIVGCVFKKTYFDSIKKCNVSKVVGPKDLVVNYWASSIDEAYRKTEIIHMTKNQVKENQLYELYRDIELPRPTASNTSLPAPVISGISKPSDVDDATPYTILEQHTFLDLDKDGYFEPYIIVVELESRKVLRIVARWDSDGVKTDIKGKVICITPVEYYTKYGFIPNPDGGFYDIGFGHLLGPLNSSANTIINQLVDAGTLSNLQSGFIGKGLRLRMGESPLKPGEWRVVNATGGDIKDQIYPLPLKEPSDVLFQLLGLVIQSGKELASVAEIFTGKMPGQNTPATTTMATIEQGMKVFTAIYKRTYRSLTKEFKKIFRLNSIYPENIEIAVVILDESITRQDYDQKSYDVCPTADPTSVSTTQKMLKAQQLMEILPLGTLNPMEVTRRLLEAQEQPNLEVLMQVPQQQPDPKVMEMQMKMKMEQESHQMDMAMKKFELMMKAQMAQMEMKFDAMAKQMEMQFKAQEFQMDSEHQKVQHSMDMEQGHDKLTLQKEQNDLKRDAIRVQATSRDSSKGSGSKAKN